MSAAPLTAEQAARWEELLIAFKLPTIGAELFPRLVAAGFGDALPVVLEVAEMEADDRRERRTERLLKASRLPPGKTLDTLAQDRLPKTVVSRLKELASGDFLDRAVNVLCFGLPGVGKSHLAASTMEADVERALATLLEQGASFDYVAIKAIAQPERPTVPTIAIPEPDLAGYDRLIAGGAR